MDQKKIVPNREDRLSQLTTKQIDRIIDNEKIKGLLYDRKRNIQDKYIDTDSSKTHSKDRNEKHNNVYQANFLARVNEIAIKRNIRNEESGID